jgi:hypothetical protein
LQKINFAASDGYGNVQIYADGDNCQFEFKDGNTTLVTATHVYQTFGVEQVTVIATGTGGDALFFDLPSNDTLTLRSDIVLFEGGGYRIETQNFQKANVYVVSGGNDTTMVFGENDSRIIVADSVVDRIDATTSCRVWNAKTVIAVNADETNNSVSFLNMSPGGEYHVSLDGVSAFNAQRSVSYQAIGFNHVAIGNLASGTCYLTVLLGEGSRIEAQNGQTVLTDGTRKVAMPVLNATYSFRPMTDLAPTPIALPAAAIDSLHAQPGEPVLSDNNFETSVAISIESNADDQLMRLLAWELMQNDDDTTDITIDDETDLLRFFARRIALMQLR